MARKKIVSRQPTLHHRWTKKSSQNFNPSRSCYITRIRNFIFKCLEVYKKKRTLLISGESGGFTLKETANRICASKQLKLNEIDVWWDFRLPQLSIADELAELGKG